MSVSLRARLLLPLPLLAATLVASAVLAWGFAGEREHHLAGAKKVLLAQTKLIAARQEAIANRADAVLNGLMSSPNMRPGTATEKCSDELAQRLRQEPQFTNIDKALPDGRLVCSANAMTGAVNIADRDYFQAALKRPDLVIGGVMTGRIEGKLSIAFAKAMYDETGSVASVLVLTLDLDWLSRELALNDLPEGGRLMVVDAQGNIAARFPADGAWIGKSVAQTALFQQIRAAEGPGVTEGIDLAGEHRVFAHAHLPETVSGPMYVWQSVATAIVTGPVDRLLLIELSVALGVLLAISWILAWSGNRHVVRPLRQLVRAANRFRDGDLGARTGLAHNHDEMGLLARTMDQAGVYIEKQAQNAARANPALRLLYAGNQTVQVATSELALLHDMCRVIVEVAGYRFATVSFANETTAKDVSPVARWGAAEDCVSPESPAGADQDNAQMATLMVRAVRSGKPRVSRDIASDPGFVPWREAALACGYAANLVLPLRDGDRTFGGLSIYSAAIGAFDEAETQLLTELASQLVAGVVMLRTRAERERGAQAREHHKMILERSLKQTIEAISATVEARDPYIVGHEGRVSELAVVIAREMGLSEDTIHGIQLAATIHDLGKIQVPVEILAKKGRLSETEFMLIKTHPQEGYDILKDVDFPWPIADIVRQHHERLDGSGYPLGLKGAEILLAARIVAVADVVEAMSADRPYRSGLGIDIALNEIERGRGSLYDAAVPDVCLSLFREGRFALHSPVPLADPVRTSEPHADNRNSDPGDQTQPPTERTGCAAAANPPRTRFRQTGLSADLPVALHEELL